MADHDLWRKNIPQDFDGRFGERFDDEIAPKEILKIASGILVTCLVALAVCVAVMRYLEQAAAESLDKPPSPIAAANQRQVPSGPLLQSSPEAELEQMREEMSTRLQGYGWVDEGRGLIHIPIAKAIELVAAGAQPRSSSAIAAEGEPIAEEASGE